MATLQIIVTAEGPLYLGGIRAPRSNVLRTERHLAGGLLRAALVAQWQAGSSGNVVPPWLDPPEGFLEAGMPYVTLPHLYPVPSAGDAALPLVTPVSAFRCKRSGGLEIAEITDNPSTDLAAATSHGAMDLAAHKLAFRLACGGPDSGVPIPFERRCGYQEGGSRCREPLTHLEATWIVPDGRGWRRVSTEVLRHTRVAIQRGRMSAQDEQLFSVESVPPGSRFTGLVQVPDSWVKVLKQQLEALTHLGGRLSSGYGRVRVEVAQPPRGTSSGGAVQARIEAFNDTLVRLFEDYRQLTLRPGPGLEDRCFIPIDVHTPLLLTDGADADTLELTPEMLREAMLEAMAQTGRADQHVAMAQTGKGKRQTAAVADVHLALAETHVSPLRVGGWHTGHRLLKPARLASQAGGYYLFETRRTELPALLPGLVALEREGLGERREDGYGRVLTAHPFHTWTGPA